MFEYRALKGQTVGQFKKEICQDFGIVNEDDLTFSNLGVELDNNKTIRECRLANDILISAAV